MGFTFGAPAPAAAPVTGAPAGGPAPAPAATGGFSFGAQSSATSTSTSTPATTTAAPTATTAAAPTPAAGFSFGATPAAAGGTSAAPPAAGGLFSAAAPSANKNSSATPLAAPTTNTAATAAAAPQAQAVADVPSFTSAFPRLDIQRRVAASLAKWKAHEKSADNNSGGGGDGSFAAAELLALLRVDSTAGNTTGNAAGGGGNGGTDGEEGPVGQCLANPTAILTFAAPDGGLRGRLRPSGATNAAPAPTAFGAAPNAPNNANNSNAATAGGNLAYVKLRGKLTAVTPRIASEVFQLADELKIGEGEALSLYAEAVRRSSNDGGGGESGGIGGNENWGEIRGTDWEASGDKRRRVDDPYYEGEEEEDDDEFVRMLVRGGRAGCEAKKQPGEWGPTATGGQIQPPQQQQPASEEAPTPQSAAVRAARRLFFRERSALLATLSDLIRHRVEAADQVTSNATAASVENGGSAQGAPNAMLAATDQLLQGGLVGNLIATVKELTVQAGQLEEALKAEPGVTAAAPAPAPGGLFGAPAPTTATTATTAPTNNDRSMTCALLGFARLQRQLACESLYFLAYHTQLTVEEACGIVDLLRELTNGPNDGREGGLPLLDPLADVPFPFEEAVTGAVGAGMPMTTTAWQQQPSNLYGAPPGGQWNTPQPPPLQRKNPAEWEAALVAAQWQRGRPQLLQCVSTLLLTAVAALEAQHVLVDRETHGPHDFAGNALLPPPSGGGGTASAAAVSALKPLHQRLDPASADAEESWKRRDIWGLLLIPYALLLQSAAGGQLRSPRPGDATNTNDGALDLKGTFSACLAAAAQLKSLTFARCSLLPALGASHHSSHRAASQSSATADFYFSSLAELTARYVDALGATGNLPVTREAWADEERNLAQSEWMEREQRRQFGVWAGTTANDDANEGAAEGPRPVNIMDRPDCLEDVFALATSVCDAYPAGARAFWQTVATPTDDGTVTLALAPGRALQTLELLQGDDGPSFGVCLSFLAALALADGTDNTEATNGAAAVHAFLSGATAINGTERRARLSWNAVLESIRWYAERLSPDEGAEERATAKAERIRWTSATNDTAGEESTSYYYGAGGASGMAEGARASDATSSGGDRSPSTTAAPSSSNGTNNAPQPKELDEVGRATLSALLGLLSAVASRCPAARAYVLALQLPATDGSSGGGGAAMDGSLEILFALLTCPDLPSDIAGRAFAAIAHLLPPPGNKNNDSGGNDGNGNDGRAPAQRAWELLELCQFVPIKLLSSYSSLAAGAGSASAAFSSNNAAGNNANNGNAAAVFPNSPAYGMLHRLERVEAPDGRYPATEGFLFLLSTLITVAGCPSNLGARWRLRPGCAPYVEYATRLVLPRATGTAKEGRLPFADAAAEGRLVARALEVAAAAVVRYTVPPAGKTNVTREEAAEYQRATIKAATETGLGAIVSEIFPTGGLDEDELADFIQDFRNATVPPPDPTAAAGREAMLEASFGRPVPRPKSPGFALLSDLLSDDRGGLGPILQKVLSERGGARGVQGSGAAIQARNLAAALFRDAPPTLKSAAEGAAVKARQDRSLVDAKTYEEATSALRQARLRPLPSASLLSYFERGGASGDDGKDCESCGAAADDAALWRERSVLLALRILCAAAAREEAFIRSVKAASGALTVVPALTFQPPVRGSVAHRFVDEQKVAPTKLAPLLVRASGCLPTIAEYVGYGPASPPLPLGVARGAFGLVSYVTRALPHDAAVQALCGEDVRGIGLARAFWRALSRPPSDGEEVSAGGVLLLESILDLILANIDMESTDGGPNLSCLLLGLAGSPRRNALSAVLDLVADAGFVLDPRTAAAAAKGLELIYRVCELGGGNGPSSLYGPGKRQVMDRLRSVNFWHAQLARYFGMRGPAAPSVFHEVCHSYRFGSGEGENALGLRRDTDVLHSLSWLLKGVALELHFLLGQPTQAAAQLQSLLGYLLSQPNQILLSALMDLPLGQASAGAVGARLHNIAAPPGDVLKASTRRMSGPAEVCAGYEIVDVERLLAQLKRSGPSSNESLDKAKEWAMAWNGFALRVCASAHMAQAWSDALRIALIGSLEAHDAAEEPQQGANFCNLLCSVLLRLLHPGEFDALGQYCLVPNQAYAASGSIETECAMPLSIAALSLADNLIETSGHRHGEAGYGMAEEDVARICALLAGAIASCRDSGENNGRSAVLSCALTHMLEFSAEAGHSIFPPSTPPSILNVYADAVVGLFRLSAAPVSDAKVDAHDAKRRMVALAARSGLLSLFGHLKSIEHQDSVSELFCSKVFTLDALSASVAQLVQLIAGGDNDVTFLLQQIGQFRDGAQLLARSGVMGKLLDFAVRYADEERKYLSSHSMGANGVGQPPLLNGHLSLINALLSSPLENSDRVAVATDSLELLKVYCGTFGRLLQMYPSSNDLVVTFIQALYLTYDALQKTPLQMDDALLALEGSVLRIAYQLSEFPFPSHLLPPLPTQLLNVEKIRASQMSSIAMAVGNERTWWDSDIPDSSQPLPQPPTGSIDAMTQQTFASYQNGRSSWTEGKYRYAISSAKCLEMSIALLISRVHFVAKRDMQEFCVDSVAVAKGICRCSDAARAIQDRLNTLSQPETDVTKMFGASQAMADSRSVQPLSNALNLERECLIQLGSSLGRCAEKMVCLALHEARRMAAATPSDQSSHEWAYFIGALTPALDHTQMETNGVGCAFGGEVGAEARAMASALRREMESMKASL
ncbi:hypothetical protein ACHAXT_010459 [Thalassiosira profunda]